MPKIIKYYTKSNYGNIVEYIHSDNLYEQNLIWSLTNKKTINGTIRQQIEKLTNDFIKFQEVIAPKFVKD